MKLYVIKWQGNYMGDMLTYNRRATHAKLFPTVQAAVKCIEHMVEVGTQEKKDYEIYQWEIKEESWRLS